jgi:hypothetical protein
MALQSISHPPSHNIISIAWDSDDLSLLIEFKSNRVYKYSQVPEDIAMGFASALSANDYFKSSILDMYEYSRVT